ncbi:(2Fe-2S)-binding protein [Clostridium vincentii]|uniref:BFD-like [2Fe-2S] binding domain protein n=1 Tax=Clostridium vincentii TaxID=52704 RepID=A0A2T0B7F3_9CLOT|nr:(2Fe-2S)-binding protein [Clostridium vincentii]PRR79785.1 BFD-like [2Fe-2S] binding domain protein [Clostridium vincentii]
MSKVCSCKGVTEKEIIEAVKAGAATYHDIKKVTGAGTGRCKGDKCKDKIKKIIKKNK